jgi:hypothetical protein
LLNIGYIVGYIVSIVAFVRSSNEQNGFCYVWRFSTVL